MGNIKTSENAKPFVKWAGGKGQLLEQLDKFLPSRLMSEDFTYIEPFVGGGAMLFHMIKTFKHAKRVIINDVNENLIKAYNVVKVHPETLINKLDDIQSRYLAVTDEEKRKDFYLDIRSKFNLHNVDDIQNTVYLIFLNRTCFNGLYRVNSKGEFNVPFGKYKNPPICNPANIIADSKALNSKDVIITNGDFEGTRRFIDNEGLTFYYFDPPYRPLTATASFTAYSKGNFNDDDQKRLAAFCSDIDSANCLWMLSNSDSKAQDANDTFIEDLYNRYSINKVYASRSINANPLKRGKLTELLLHNNYKITNSLFFKALSEYRSKIADIKKMEQMHKMPADMFASEPLPDEDLPFIE